MSDNLIYKFNDKCDTCQRFQKMLAVVEGSGKLCNDCLAKRFKDKCGVSPDEMELDEASKEQLKELANQVAKKLKNENE